LRWRNLLQKEALPQLDARLRPEGEKGTLVCSLATYEAYYETRAQLWEAQALHPRATNCWPAQDQFMEIAGGVWRKAGQRDDLFHKLIAMLLRIRHDRGLPQIYLILRLVLGA
jgi:glutamine synthetase adenylyltransferase